MVCFQMLLKQLGTTPIVLKALTLGLLALQHSRKLMCWIISAYLDNLYAPG